MTGWVRGQHVSGYGHSAGSPVYVLHQVHQPWSVTLPEEQDKVHEVNSSQRLLRVWSQARVAAEPLAGWVGCP